MKQEVSEDGWCILLPGMCNSVALRQVLTLLLCLCVVLGLWCHTG